MKQLFRTWLLVAAMIAGGASSELHAMNGVSYVDSDGTVKTRDGVTVLNDDLDLGNLAPGWYYLPDVVGGSIDFINVREPKQNESGDLHIIVEDGVRVNIRGGQPSILNTYGSIFLHAESKTGTPGTLVPGEHGNTPCIFAQDYLEINGVNIEIDGKTSGSGIYSRHNLTVNGGNIIAMDGGTAINCEGTFTMNGGTVIATALGGIRVQYGINFNGGNLTTKGIVFLSNPGNVTLKWTSLDDSFTASGIMDGTTFTIADGYKFIDEDYNTYSGSYTSADFPNGITLTPYPNVTVTSLDTGGNVVKKKYLTFDDAFTAACESYVAPQGSTVQEFVPTIALMEDVNVGSADYTIGEDDTPAKLTLNLNGHNYTGDYEGGLFTVKSGAKLTLIDNGGGQQTRGTLTNSCTTGNGTAILVDGGTLEATGIDIASNKGMAVSNYGTALFTDCTLSGCWGIDAYGPTTVTNTTISATEYGIFVYGADVTFGAGASITGYTKSGIKFDSGTITPTVWPTFSKAEDSDGADIMFDEDQKLAFGMGTFPAPQKAVTLRIVDSEDQDINPAGYSNPITEGYAAAFTENGSVIDPNRVFRWYDPDYNVCFGFNDDDEVYFGSGNFTVTSRNYDGSPETTFYTTFNEALNAALSAYVPASGDTPAFVPTLTLFDEVTGLTTGIDLGDGDNINEMVLNLNGHTLSGSAERLIDVHSGSSLTVVDSGEDGSIETTGDYAIHNDGSLTVKGGKFAANYICIESYGDLTVSGGTFDLGSTSNGIYSKGSFILNVLPTFVSSPNKSYSDIWLDGKSKITFSEGTYVVPEHPITVRTSAMMYITFTSGYSANILDAEGHVIDPDRIFLAGGTNSDFHIGFNEDKSELIISKYVLDFSLSNEGDNSGEIILNRYGTVTLTGRTITRDGTWNTLCLPFYVTLEGSPLEGFTVKRLDEENSYLSSDGVLNIQFVAAGDGLAAGVPYILKWEGESADPLTEDDLVFPNVTIGYIWPETVIFGTEGGVQCAFVGQFSSFEINDGTAAEGFHSNVNNIDEILFLTSDAATGKTMLGYSKSPRQLRSCRAHFYVPALQTGDGKPANSVRSVLLDFGDGTPTAITDLRIAGDATSSPSSTGWYSMDGRRLQGKPAQKGVYIHQGRKIVVK